MDRPTVLYLEDFHEGQAFTGAARQAMTAEAIKAFAAEFDPQPFHLDEATALATFFSGLAASGWHTAAATMRLIVDALPVAGGGDRRRRRESPGRARPARATCSASSCTVETVTPSRSRPDRGMRDAAHRDARTSATSRCR